MDAILVKTWTLGQYDIKYTRPHYFICHNALMPMS